MSTLFGKYQLLERIKVGGMAEIWLAKERGIEDFERLVVIKKVLPGLSEDKSFIDMFLDEGRIAAQLNHPNIVQIYELDKIDDSYYIAMEYIPGVNLQELFKVLKKSQIPVLFICRIISRAAKGLHFAHISKDIYGNSLNIVHRDISPQNILVSYDGVVKIVDFGIAKAASQSNKTKTGTLKGKLSYMSPEQISGVVLDKRSDVFALGIVLYELTTGRRLFKGKSEINVIRMIADIPIVAPSTIDVTFPKELSFIIMKALEKDPDKRYSSAHELEVDLEQYILKQRDKNIDVELVKWLNTIFQNQILKIKEHHKTLVTQKEDIEKNNHVKIYLFLFFLVLLTVFGFYMFPKIKKNKSNTVKNVKAEHKKEKKVAKIVKPVKKIKKDLCKSYKCNSFEHCLLKDEKPVCVCDEHYYSSSDGKCFKKYNLRTVSGKYKDIITDIIIDSKGNRYITGYFYGSIEFDGEIYKAKTKNKSDIFITKIDQYDKHIWTQVIGGDWNDYPEAITVDKLDNIYITGSFSGTVDFNFGKDIDSKHSNGLLDVFITKINSDGSYGWTKTFGGSTYLDRGTSIITDKENNIYIGGWFSGRNIEIEHHKNISVKISSKGNADFFIVKLNENGEFIWNYNVGSTEFDGVTDLFINNDKLYVTGFFSKTIRINKKNYKSKGKEDIIIFTLDTEKGLPAVIKTFGTKENDRASTILINDDSIYISGYFQGDFTTPENKILKNRGYSDIFIGKFNKKGDYLWLKTIGGRGDDATSDMIKYKDKLYLTGWFQTGVDFDPSENTDLKPSYGSQDIFITIFNLDGEYERTSVIGGEKQDKSRSILIDKENNLYLIGWFKGTIDFDLSPAKDHHTSKGLEDAFVLRWHLKQ